MTLTQHVLIWSLRALTLWAVAELGLAGFDEAVREREVLDRLNGLPALTARLERRAQESERLAAAAEAELSVRRHGAATLVAPVGSGADTVLAALIRRDLTELGAQQPQVGVTVAATGPDLSHAVIEAGWTEPLANAPQVLPALGVKRPYLRAAKVLFSRVAGGGQIRVNVQLQLDFKIQRRAAP